MREYRRHSLALLLILSLSFLVTACSYNYPEVPEDESDPGVVEGYYPDWSESTHGNSTDPNYDIVFPQGDVERLDFVINDPDWQAMLADMTDLYGSFGSGGGHPSFSDDNPIWAPCSVFFNGTEWYQVGIRFKGNSSLMSAWQSGIMKLPLKLDFDQYEDSYPDLRNQRFHGFKQLSLSSGYDDESLIRAKVAADIFRDAGVPAAHTAFYRIYIDHGDGPIYFGLYTMVEVIDDTVIEDQFEEDNGNLYKPDGTGASFASGTFSSSDFEKKSNEDTSDWSDIEALFAALHQSNRTTDPVAWRTDLESVLNVDDFLNWLAVNTVIQNWDTYGLMTHNYYLYNDPANGLLTWIPWDNNESLQEGKMGGALPIDFSGVSSQWPLIRYLYDDTTYRARYEENVEALIEETFSAANMVPIYQAAASLVEPYVTGAEGELEGYTFLSWSGAFVAAQAYLINHVFERVGVAEAYLAE